MEHIRSFIAIELSPNLREKLAELENRLRSGGRFRAKWVNPDSIHLTLKFLGNVAVDRIEEIGAVTEDAVQGIPPFRLEVGELGAFPSLERVRVVWIGLGGDLERLGLLHQRLEAGLEPLGFLPEERPFRPHLTLARLYDDTTAEERRELGKHITGMDAEIPALYVDTVQLIKSQLTGSGAVYTTLSSARLGA